MQWMDQLAESCGDACSVEVIGKSFEGRDLKLIKVHGKIDLRIVRHFKGIQFSVKLQTNILLRSNKNFSKFAKILGETLASENALARFPVLNSPREFVRLLKKSKEARPIYCILEIASCASDRRFQCE